MTIEMKIAKNGAIRFFNAETGKQIKEADAVAYAIENDGIFYTASVHGYDVDNFVTKEFMSPITAYKWICRMARKSTTYADGDARIVVGFHGEIIYTQKMGIDEIKNAELRAYVEEKEAAAEVKAETSKPATVEEKADYSNSCRFVVDIYSKTANGVNKRDSVEAPTAQLAGQAVIEYAAEHTDCKVLKIVIKDFVAYAGYYCHDADIAALYPTIETTNELPTGEITVDSGAEAWSLVGKHFPKGNLEFYRAYKGFNNEDKFCYTLDEIIYVHVTCTPDNSRVELIEVINTYESGSKRKPLTVYIKPAPASDDAVTNNVVETCATVQIATDSAPVDDFSAKLSAFDANVAKAENARNAAKAAYNKADAEARNAIAARQEFLDNVAGNLTRKLQAACVNNDFIQTTTIHGRLYTIGDFGNVYIDPTANGGFAFVTYDNRTLARYDTPAQIEAVIARIKDTIDRKDVVFYFPTIDELNKPAAADSLTRAMTKLRREEAA